MVSRTGELGGRGARHQPAGLLIFTSASRIPSRASSSRARCAPVGRRADAVDPAADLLDHRLAQAQSEPGGPAGEVVGDGVEDQPGSVAAEALGREMGQAHGVLEVADGQLHLGMTAVVGLEVEQVDCAVGDDREERVLTRFLANASVGGVRSTSSRTGTASRVPHRTHPRRRLRVVDGEGLSERVAMRLCCRALLTWRARERHC